MRQVSEVEGLAQVLNINGYIFCNGFLLQRFFVATATFGDGNSFSALDDRFAVFAFSHYSALGFKMVRLIGGNLDSYFFFMSCRCYKSCASPDNFFY